MVQIKNWKTGEIIHEFEGTIKQTLEDASKHMIDLSYADLRDVDISGVVCEGDNFSFADFTDANLKGANLGWCRFEGANFENAILRNVNFRSAILDNVILECAILDGANFDGTIHYGINCYV